MAPQDDELRALGRFTYDFSRLISAMRRRIHGMTLGGQPMQRIGELMILYTGEMTAGQVANLFFGIAERVADYTDEEASVAKRLRGRVLSLIEVRNAFMHGDWSMGWAIGRVGEEPQPVPPNLMRALPARKGSKITWTSYTVPQLDALADEIDALTKVVSEWGYLIERGDVSPGDVYVMRDGKVVREGPASGHDAAAPSGQ